MTPSTRDVDANVCYMTLCVCCVNRSSVFSANTLKKRAVCHCGAAHRRREIVAKLCEYLDF